MRSMEAWSDDPIELARWIGDGAGCLESLVDGSEADSGLGGARLTAATLPAAETAPTARVDCRRAFRNILREVREVWR